MSGYRYPPTRSGAVQLRELTDEEALALVAGDIVFVATPRGAASVVVERVRYGKAGEQDAPYDVPVIDAWGGLTYAVPDLLVCEELAAAVVALAPLPASLVSGAQEHGP